MGNENEDREFTDLERTYQKAIERLSGQVADLTANLTLAHAQLEVMEENTKKENAE